LLPRRNGWEGSRSEDLGALPIRFARDFSEARQRGIAVAGTLARGGEKIERRIAASGGSYFVRRLMFGNMTEAEASASIDPFSAEVLPHLIKLAPAAV
jgi:hypothetical protein